MINVMMYSPQFITAHVDDNLITGHVDDSRLCWFINLSRLPGAHGTGDLAKDKR